MIRDLLVAGLAHLARDHVGGRTAVALALDDRDAPVRDQRAERIAKEGGSVGDPMIGVAQEQQVDRAVETHEGVRAVVGIEADDAARRPDRLGEAALESIVPRTEIHNGVAWIDAEQRDHGVALSVVARDAFVGEALPRCASAAGEHEQDRGERETSGSRHRLAQFGRARGGLLLSPGMARRSCWLLSLWIAFAFAPALANAQRTRADQVPLGELIEIVVMEDEILGVDAESGGSSVVRRRLGEPVLWTGVRGRVGVVITDQRVLAISPRTGGWQEAAYERGERPARYAELGDRVALIVMPGRVLGFLGTVGRWVQVRLGPQEDLRAQSVGANVAVVVTSRAAIGLSPEAGGFFSIRLQLRERIAEVSARSNLATVNTDQRVLVFRAPTGTWAERRR